MEIYGNFFDQFAKKYNKTEAIKLVHIEIEIIRMCQQHCFYCFARNNNAKWNTFMTLKQFKKILNELKKSKHKLRISLMGGEPTLHKQLYLFCLELLSLKQLIELEIFTNSLKYIHLPNDKRLHIIASFHPTETRDMEQFKTNILKYKNKYNDSFIVYLMTVLKHESFKKIKDIRSFCVMHNIKSNLEYIFINGELKRYNELNDNEYKTYKILDKETRYVSFNNKKISINEIYQKKLNSFFNFNCYITRLLKIRLSNVDSFTIECCRGQHKNYNDYLVPIKGYLEREINPIKCQFNQCDTLASISTYKNDF